jgi:hypothetical protein
VTLLCGGAGRLPQNGAPDVGLVRLVGLVVEAVRLIVTLFRVKLSWMKFG